MGQEFGLYHDESKEFIWLGKSRHAGDAPGFQIHSEKIAAFLLRHVGGTFRMLDDCGDLPHYDDPTWVEIADWCEGEDSDAKFTMKTLRQMANPWSEPETS